MAKRKTDRTSTFVAKRARTSPATKTVVVTPRRSVMTPSLLSQVKALLASKQRDATDVARNNAALAGATTVSCLTSTTDFATAVSGTGLIEADCDEAHLNHVRIKGQLINSALLDVDPSSGADSYIRVMVVQFNKPLLVASAAGTLPPITEVLVTDALTSLPVTDAANGGRFKILSNKLFNMGTNTFAATTAVGSARVSGVNNRFIDYTVKINKQCKFKSPTLSGGTSAGGHYDSDVPAGQVDNGLIVMYVQSTAAGFGTLGMTLNTRLNYTA